MILIISSEQQKVKEVELFLAKEKAAHASLRADYVSEQIKVKELEERLFKTEKQLKKAQVCPHSPSLYYVLVSYSYLKREELQKGNHIVKWNYKKPTHKLQLYGQS